MNTCKVMLLLIAAAGMMLTTGCSCHVSEWSYVRKADGTWIREWKSFRGTSPRDIESVEVGEVQFTPFEPTGAAERLTNGIRARVKAEDSGPCSDENTGVLTGTVAVEDRLEGEDLRRITLRSRWIVLRKSDGARVMVLEGTHSNTSDDCCIEPLLDQMAATVAERVHY